VDLWEATSWVAERLVESQEEINNKINTLFSVIQNNK
jgi:hypothetical protein